MAHNYVKIELIGKGSFGQVFLAKKSNSNSTQRYVIKDIDLNGLCADKREKTLMEVEILGLCRHRNIVRYRDSYINNSLLSIVMEYMPGGDLHAKILSQNGVHFEEKIILHWFIQICYALRHIHDMKIMHRDLKSQNILLSADMKYVKIADFGISRTLDNSESFATTSIGTPYYLSPEQCMQKPYNYKTDIWAMGCVLYELCALKLPFSAGDLKSLILAITDSKYPPINKNYGVLVTDLLDVSLQKNPMHRPTATQLLLIPSLQIYIKNYTTMLKRDDAEHKLNQSTRRSINKSSSKLRSQSLSTDNSQASKPSKSRNNLFRKMIENKYDIRKSVSDGNINKSSTSSASACVATSCDQEGEHVLSDCSLSDSVFSDQQSPDKHEHESHAEKEPYQPFNQGFTYRIISQDRYDIDIDEFMTSMIPKKSQSLSDYRRIYRAEIIRIFGAARLQRCQEYVMKCSDYKNVPANDKRLLPLVIQLISLYKLR